MDRFADIRRCIEHGDHLRSMRHTANECPVAGPRCVTDGCNSVASFDGESGSYFARCETCSLSGGEHCIAPACLIGGHTWREARTRRNADGSYVFTCPACGFEGDRVAWWTRKGTISGEADVMGPAWRIEGRRERELKLLIDAHTPARSALAGLRHHTYSPANVAYARAYLAATA